MLVLFDVTEKKGIKLESKRPRLDFDDGGEGEGEMVIHLTQASCESVE